MVKKRLIEPKISKNMYEKEAWSQAQLVCGLDEVGRGCLAGPLVTAAVILPPGTSYRLLKDSKILSESDRLKAHAWITEHCWYGYGIVHNRLIDERNIWQATLIAMKKALLNALSTCPQRPSAIVVDAMPLTILDTNYRDIPVYHFTQGETRSSSIAAASIIAKVKRDQLMEHFDPIFPGYGLATHKEYATATHTQAIKTAQESIIHRATFLRNLKQEIENHEQEQQSIC